MTQEVNQEEDIETITPAMPNDSTEGTNGSQLAGTVPGENRSRRRKGSCAGDGHRQSKCGILISTREALINTLSLVFTGGVNENTKGCIRYTPTRLMRILCGTHVSPTFISLAHNILEKLYSAGYIQYKFISRKKYNGKEVTARAIYLVCHGRLYDAVRNRDLQTLKQILDSVL